MQSIHKKQQLSVRNLATALVCAIALITAIAIPSRANAADSGGTVEMYRLYNPNSGEHFYTANSYERDDLAGRGWHYEGVGWVAPVHSNTPVYRLYNPNAGDHHYTINTYERDSLIRVGWRDEGIGWYSSDTNRNYPLYRQYNPNAIAGAHNYTLNRNENDQLVRLGWRAEGIAWYGVGPGYGVSTGNGNTGTDVYYANCDAVRAAGKAPLYRGQPGYRPGLDRDNDGIACEVK